MTRRPAVVLALLTAVLAAGCTVDAPQAPTVTPGPERTAVPTATPTAAPDPSPTTAPTPAWPTAMNEQTAMSAPDLYSVVWLATARSDRADQLDAVQERAEDLGYGAAATPVRCVDPAPADLMDDDESSSTWGVPVYFVAASDAELFVTLWAAPVVAVVHDVHLACDWG